MQSCCIIRLALATLIIISTAAHALEHANTAKPAPDVRRVPSIAQGLLRRCERNLLRTWQTFNVMSILILCLCVVLMRLSLLRTQRQNYRHVMPMFVMALLMLVMCSMCL